MGLRGPGARPVKKAGDKPKKRRPSWRAKGLSRAEAVIRFIEGLKITSGAHAGRNFVLRPWQREIVEAIYATNADGKRVVRQALVTCPRKQGKTQLAAALALAHLAGPEAEQRGQIFSAAADRDQAAIIFREMLAMITADAALSERIIVREHNKTLTDIETGSVYQALSSDARKAHGLSPSFVVCDELAQWLSRDLYDNLITGTGARAEPLAITISTQSADPAHVMSELVAYGRRVLDGDVVDPTFLPVIYSAPDDADPWSEETWFACNPALGDFRSLEEMRTAAEQAKRLPAREPVFRLLYLNQPVQTEARFLNAPEWRACRSEIDIAGTHAGARCYLGLDLSSTTDLTSLAAYFPETGACLSWSWMPGDTIDEAERRDHQPYRLWAKQGFLEATPGKVVDKRYVVRRIAEIVSRFDVVTCAYDRWGAKEFEKILSEEGVKLKLEPFGQGYQSMSPALSALETLVLKGELKHPGSPVLDWAVANGATVQDPAGNRKLVKPRATGRIDPLIALVMAVGTAAQSKAKQSVYRTRGVLTVDVAA